MKFGCILFLGVLLSYNQISIGQELTIKENCSIEGLTPLRDINLLKLDKQSFTLMGYSTEGANVDVYKKAGKLISVNVELYGEFSKQTISYYFSQRNSSYSIIEFSEYYYNDHIMQDDFEISSQSKYDFVVCEQDKSAKYLTSDVIEDARASALELLEDVMIELK